ncbi:MAG TPA: hypothetical protein VM943_00365 [Pyrinomonadaceae bacterium]|nr:hypothetical protein [Pyrinomonadaceae bacterium]
MEAALFWSLLEDACEMGKFIVAVPNSAASANIVGKIELGDDDGEKVLQRRNRPNVHVHFKPEMIAEFAFVHLDVGFGREPCLELRSTEGQPIVRLYYKGRRAAGRYDRFMRKNAAHEAFITGSWSRERETQAGEEKLNDETFVIAAPADDDDEARVS